MDIHSRYKHISKLMKDNNLNANLDLNNKDATSANITPEINNNNNDNELQKNDKSNSNNVNLDETKEKLTCWKVNEKRLFILNINYEVHENLLERFLSKFGRIKKVKIIRDEKNKSKGIGYAEFFDEKDAQKAHENARPADLMLKERQMTLIPYVKMHKKPRIKRIVLDDQTNQLDTDTRNQTTNKEININELPVDVLINILKQLCLRDLCVAEQVCKKWYNVAHTVWSTKKKLILNDENIFGKYVPKKKSLFGISLFPSKKLKLVNVFFFI